MSMWGSSMWVGKAHSTNQVPNLRTYGWTACAAPTLPPPIEPTPLAMPGDDGRRLTMSRADRQAFHNCESQTKRTRSAQRNGAFDRGSNAAGPRADGEEKESLLLKQREFGTPQTGEESAWPGKATRRGFANAMISACRSFWQGQLAERLEASGYDIPANEIAAGMELHLPCLVRVGQGNKGYQTIEAFLSEAAD
jgi:hypothetical protein